MNTNAQAIATDRMRQLIAESRRRTVHRHLIENGDEAVPVEERIAGFANNEVPPEDGNDPVGRITTEPHHVNLSTLADASRVDDDRRRATVRYQPHSAGEELLRPGSEITTEAGEVDVDES